MKGGSGEYFSQLQISLQMFRYWILWLKPVVELLFGPESMMLTWQESPSFRV